MEINPITLIEEARDVRLNAILKVLTREQRMEYNSIVSQGKEKIENKIIEAQMKPENEENALLIVSKLLRQVEL